MPRTTLGLLELIIGLTFLFLGWIISLLMVVHRTYYSIPVSILGYILSLIGLILSTYGLTSILFAKKKIDR